MQILVRKFLKDESGATAIEYGLMALGVSVAIFAVVQTIGPKLVALFTKVEPGLS
jgi:pilus assembly protein Flp/PilA